MPVRLRNYISPLYWDEGVSRYRDARGRFVAWEEVQQALTRAMDRAARTIETAARQLADDALTLAQWQRLMTEQIRAVHVTSAALAHGGLHRMSEADLQRVQATIRRELGFLQGFAEQIADGRQPFDGFYRSRAGMYARAGRETFTEARNAVRLAEGFTHYENIRGTNDSCSGCISATKAGVVPIGTLPPIGTRDCLRNCGCTWRYHNPATGEAVDV